jgi:hypothetical protein
MHETNPSPRRSKPASLSDRLRVAIDRLTDPELQVSERRSDKGLVEPAKAGSGSETSVAEVGLDPIGHFTQEEA